MVAVPDGVTLLTDLDLAMEKGLPAMEVDRRLAALAHVHRRVESVLCFYLQEVDQRRLYLDYSCSSTIHYAKERLGFEERKTWSLLNMARRLQVLPKMKQAFQQGRIPWTKAREAVKAATPETDQKWLEKCFDLSNRQLEQEVKQTLPPVRKITLTLVLEDDMIDTWEQTREACQRLAGQTLSNSQIFDLMCAEMLCTYALTPPFDPENEQDGGYARSIYERDGGTCTRPGCSCRTGLQGHHLTSRGQGGGDEDSNKTLVCAVCHHAVNQGRLKTKGRAPDQLIWEGPLGVIEKPLPLSKSTRETNVDDGESKNEPEQAKEEAVSYGDDSTSNYGSPSPVGWGERTRDQNEGMNLASLYSAFGTGHISNPDRRSRSQLGIQARE